MAKKYETGYKTIDEAIKDKFAKIGGWDEAIVLLEKGWYTAMMHKEQTIKNSKLRELMKSDSRYKSIVERAKEQMSKEG